MQAVEPEALPFETELLSLLEASTADASVREEAVRELRTAHAELRSVFTWFKQNAPKGSQLDLDSLWDALPDSGTLDAAGFEKWLLGVTKELTPDAFEELSTKLQEYLEAKTLLPAARRRGRY